MAYGPDAQIELNEDVQRSKKTINVAFQGERGAFGDEAARTYFGQKEDRKSVV